MARPVPAGIEPPSQWEIILRQIETWFESILPPVVIDFFGSAGIFFQNYWLEIVIILGVVLLMRYGIKRLKKKDQTLEKMWKLVLFFLMKRQMMIPLVITLSKREKVLTEKIQKELLTIRQQSREVKFKQNPKERFALEMKISEALYVYFSTLEKQGKLTDPVLKKLGEDFEFIDQKLTDLQHVYNKYIDRWNNRTLKGIKKNILGLFGLRIRQTFEG